MRKKLIECNRSKEENTSRLNRKQEIKASKDFLRKKEMRLHYLSQESKVKNEIKKPRAKLMKISDAKPKGLSSR